MMNHPHRFGIRENSLRVASCLIAWCVLVGEAQATEPFFEKSVLFEEQTDGFVLYRIPGIAVTAMRCFSIHSDDDGQTWSSPIEITSALNSFREHIDWQAIATGPGHGIELSNGRLIVPVWMSDYRLSGRTGKAAATIYSDDGGTTWHAGNPAIPTGGEANVVERSDGSVMLTARNGDSRNRRLVTFSSNGFSDWSAPRIADELKEPGCMAGVTKHSIDQDVPYKLLFSNAQTAKRKHSARRNLTIHLSRNDGITWSIQRTIEPGPSAYSDLAVLSDGTILCFYESGVPKPKIERTRDWAYANLSLARFNLAWIEGRP